MKSSSLKSLHTLQDPPSTAQGAPPAPGAPCSYLPAAPGPVGKEDLTISIKPSRSPFLQPPSRVDFIFFFLCTLLGRDGAMLQCRVGGGEEEIPTAGFWVRVKQHSTKESPRELSQLCRPTQGTCKSQVIW